jgi:hypothetical protein
LFDVYKSPSPLTVYFTFAKFLTCAAGWHEHYEVASLSFSTETSATVSAQETLYGAPFQVEN